MTTTRATALIELQTRLRAGVPLVNGQVLLPWEERSEPGPPAALHISLQLNSEIDTSHNLVQWRHDIPLHIAAVRNGTTDYQASWEILQQAAAVLAAASLPDDPWLQLELLGCHDTLTVPGGDRVWWPHLLGKMVLITAAGTL